MANYQEAKVNKYAMKKIKICRKADLKNIKNKQETLWRWKTAILIISNKKPNWDMKYLC